MSKKKSLIFKVILGIVVAFVIWLFLVFSNIKSEAAAVTIHNVDLTQVKDGTYKGSYTISPVSAEVSVTVKNHTIENLVIDSHQNGLGGKAEEITDLVLSSGQVDQSPITGATVSSKVILKAIENALTP